MKTNILKEDFLNIKEKTIDFFLDTMRGKHTEDEYIDYLLAGTNWHISHNEMKTLFRENLNIQIDGMMDLIKKLSINYNIVLLSDHVKEWVDFILANNRDLDIFKYKFFSYDIGKLKMDKGTFEYVLNAMNFNASETIFVDDSPHNVKVATLSGLKGIVFENVDQLTNDLKILGIENI